MEGLMDDIFEKIDQLIKEKKIPKKLLPDMPNPGDLDLEQMSLIDLVKTICKYEIDKYLKPAT